MISHPALQEIQDRLNIVDLIGGYLSLKRAGKNFKGLCPFHPEKTPSFVVYPEKQFFICYGCGAGGDLIAFVMKHERLEFPEAVELLAQKAGVPAPEFGGRSASSGKSARSYKVHEWAAGVYHDLLLKSPEAKEARAYLEKRGLDPATWDNFQLGYAPERWDHLVRAADQEGFTPEELEQAGLAIRREQGQGWYDRFRGRVQFPIWDSRGRVIAFGGRILQDDPKSPKYMNSPETGLYVKGKVLYGLHLASAQMRELDFCIVVEGYLDMITPFRHGFRNIVASMGTALTEPQVKLIRRQTRHVVIVYDGDYAGQAATLRGLDLFLQAEMRVKVAVLPGGTDPDSLIRNHGPEAFAKVLKECKELFDYKLGLLTRQSDPKELEGRIAICREMLPTIKRVPNVIQRGDYIRRLSEILGVGEPLLWKEMERVKLDSEWRPAEMPAPFKAVSLAPEEVLAGLLLEDPRQAGQVEGRVNLEELRDPLVRQVVGRLLEKWPEADSGAGPRDLRKGFPEASEQERGRMARWLAEADSIEEKERALDELVARIRSSRQQESLGGLRASLREAEELGNEKEANRLIAEINRMVRFQTARPV